MIEAQRTFPDNASRVKTPGKLLDLTGHQFGRITVTARDKSKRRVYWFCKCECGNTATIAADSLVMGRTVSCGCYKDQRRAESHTTHGAWKGGVESGAHKSWRCMMARCYNERAKEYPHYGGRGIKVCSEWHAFEGFLKSMGERGHGLSIERKDTDGDYCPGNCVWATYTTQQNNRRNNHRLAFRGEEKTVAEWAVHTGISPKVLYARIYQGLSVERVLTQPVRVLKPRRK